jgi:acetyltransferase-like isoleucine patch superfamily enzyme
MKLKTYVTGKLRLAAWRVLGGIPRCYPGYLVSGDSRVGDRTSIDMGTTILGSTLGNDSRIGGNVLIWNSVLAEHVIVEDQARLVRSTLSEWTAVQVGASLSGSAVDSFSYIARNAVIAVTQAGRFCSVGPNVVCGAGDHPVHWMSTSPVFYSPLRQCGTAFSAAHPPFEELRPVTIGPDVWIGANAVIRNGITIGPGAIIGATACVTKDVAPYSIVAGVPARVIGARFSPEIVERLLSVRWWDFQVSVLKSNAFRWNATDVRSFLEWAESVRNAEGGGPDALSPTRSDT